MLFTGNWISFGLLLILLVFSATSWAIIFTKWMQLRRSNGEDLHFNQFFAREKTLADIFNFATKLPHSPNARLYEASFKEIQIFRKSMENNEASADYRERLMTSLSRRLESVYNQQNALLESRLPFLAIVSSSSPYIGLFGTVLGIIDAFRSIGTMGVTSLAVVAPGISEALVATAAGLMAAIPALIAYNVFRNRIREQNTRMKIFALDVSNRLERLF